MREIDWIIKGIMKRKNSDMKFTATVHGMEIKTPAIDREAVSIEVSEEQEQALLKAQQEARARIGKRHGR